MGRSTAEIQSDLDAWIAARTKAAQGKSATIATGSTSITVTFQDMAQINAEITRLQRELAAAQNPDAPRHSYIVPNFNC